MSLRCNERMNSRVENDIRYKTGYPRRLVDFLYYESGFSKESVIADIGSGTGFFSRLLLERGSRVVGIEPDQEMREISERILSDEFPRFVSIDGCAENTTLSEASVNHIVCTQSFQWLDAEKCRKEFARILKPNGLAVLVCNRYAADDEFSMEYCNIIKRYGRSGKTGDNAWLSDSFTDFFGSSTFSVLSIPHQQVMDYEELKARLLFALDPQALEEQDRNELMEEIELLFELYNQAGKVVVRFETEAWLGKLNSAI